MTTRHALLATAAAAFLLARSVPTLAAEQWDMPLAYAATNFIRRTQPNLPIA
jgi:hypothetical protein